MPSIEDRMRQRILNDFAAIEAKKKKDDLLTIAEGFVASAHKIDALSVVCESPDFTANEIIDLVQKWQIQLEDVLATKERHKLKGPMSDTMQEKIIAIEKYINHER